MATWLTLLLATLATFIISALPLCFSVKLLGGRTGLFKVILVNFLVALVVFVVNFKFQTWAGVVAFVATLLIYKVFFRMGWLRALVAWLLQFVFAAIIVVLLTTIFGVSVVLF
ncbi:hypothetical protein GF367_02510 [Candidatus Woesearchaeota archaeon]|nr:hypothetical protein [Candidatus Woesearchaeota archaeon]